MPSHKKTYQCYQDMRGRCLNPKAQQYKNYGARGITICDRWLEGYDNFLLDMGEKPDGLTLERLNNDAGYSARNCKWATRKEQRHNQRTCHYLEHNGERKPLREWARMGGISDHTFLRRIRKGWSVERAMTERVNQNRARAGLKGCRVRYAALASQQRD